MSIRNTPSQTAKYFVLVTNGKNLPPALHKNPTVCSFYGLGYFSTVRKDAYHLAKYLHSLHPDRVYSVLTLNCSDTTAITFGE